MLFRVQSSEASVGAEGYNLFCFCFFLISSGQSAAFSVVAEELSGQRFHVMDIFTMFNLHLMLCTLGGVQAERCSIKLLYIELVCSLGSVMQVC